MTIGALRVPLVDGDLRIEPLVEAHREALRAACAADADIWAMYPVCMTGPDFDRNLDIFLAAPDRAMVAIVHRGALAGMSSFGAVRPADRSLEIGMTYLTPAMRGTGVNARMKALMIGHAFACGYDRIEFRVDTRNARSQAAMAKLGAVREGTMRRDRITWTGYARDTAVFSILRDERAS